MKKFSEAGNSTLMPTERAMLTFGVFAVYEICCCTICKKSGGTALFCL